jgi:hypothetical protein
MSNLRQHLRQARAEYREAGYPGDLAAEILPPRGAWLRWMLRTVVGGTLAAVLAVMVSNRAADPQSDTPFHARHADRTHHGASPTPIVYNLPARMPLALPAAPFLAATPPVLVSLRADALERFQQPYEEFMSGRFMDQLNRRRVAPTQQNPEIAPDSANPTTQAAAVG